MQNSWPSRLVFQLKGGRWLAFLVPVEDGSELDDAENAKTKFAVLKQAGIFKSGNVYKLYAGKLAFPLTGNTPEQINQSIATINDDFLADTRTLSSSLGSKFRSNPKSFLSTSSSGQALQGKMQSVFGKERMRVLQEAK